jgi:ADP-ribosylglycohydrolase
MLGAIAGDIIGSVYKWNNIKTEEFELFGKNSRSTEQLPLQYFWQGRKKAKAR